MTLNKLMHFGRKQVPIRRTDEYNPPSLCADSDDPWRDLDRLFDRFFSPSQRLAGMHTEFSPSLDVLETDKEFQIAVEVPGMSDKDIELQISRDRLTISGEKKEEKEENARGIYRMERRYGSFSRSIPLPENCVDTDKAEASFKDGVLSVRLPKTDGYKESVKKIPVVSQGQGPTDGNGAPK